MKWQHPTPLYLVLIMGQPNSVYGFAPSADPNNAVFDAIRNMENKMSKYQKDTMEILNDINSGLKGLLEAKRAASAVIPPEKMTKKTMIGNESINIRTDVVTFNEKPKEYQINSSEMLVLELPQNHPAYHRHDEKQAVLLQRLSREGNLPPPIDQKEDDIRLVALPPDPPFQDDRQQQQLSPFSSHKGQPSRQPQKLPSLSAKQIGLVALPPDQPFLNSGQQFINTLPGKYNTPRQSSLAHRVIGLQPDQPLDGQYYSERRQQLPQQKQKLHTSSSAKAAQVVLVGLQPDQPFGHIMTHQQPHQHHRHQNPISGSKIATLRPDQRL